MFSQSFEFTLASLVTFVLGTCAIIAVVPLNSPPSDEHLIIGFLIGSVFGHTFLASAWIVLGPGMLILRIPGAFAWGIAIAIAILANSLIYAHSVGMEVVYLSQLGVASLSQLLAWLVRLGLGIRLGNAPAGETAYAERVVPKNQYGIQHLMILTTVIAIAIAIGRILLGSILSFLRRQDFLIFAFLALAACLICVPLLFSLLSMRRPGMSLLVLGCFVGLVTYLEMPLLKNVAGAGGPDSLHILLINFFTLLPVGLLAGGLRYHGYRLIYMQKQ